MSEEVLFFENSQNFRRWLEQHANQSNELWVGFYKKSSGIPSMTWPESVDQALCFGWIDGLRKSIDEQRYKIRFTPRKANSHWSAVNIARISELKKLGLIQAAGLKAFANRNPRRSRLAAYEQSKKIELSEDFKKEFQKNPKAWQDFKSRSPSYQKQCIWWAMSAKKEETRKRRLKVLIDSCEAGQKIPPLRWQK